MKNYKIILSLCIIFLISVASLLIYFSYAKKQNVELNHIVCYSFDDICYLDFGYIKNSKVTMDYMNERKCTIKVPDLESFIEKNIKTHEDYKFSRVDTDGNEEIILAKHGYVFTLIHNKQKESIEIYDNFGDCNDWLFPYLKSGAMLLTWGENGTFSRDLTVSYDELNISLYGKRYVESVFTNYQTIKQFYLEFYGQDNVMCNDDDKSIRLNVVGWHRKNDMTSDYPIEIVCGIDYIYLHSLREL